MPDTKDPSNAHPPDSNEYFWGRILSQTLTQEDALALWKRVGDAADAVDAADGPADSAREYFEAVVEGAERVATRNDFVATVLEINRNGDTDERLVLSMLAGGNFDKAEEISERIVANSGARQAEKLGSMGALFAPSHPAIARSAWERLLKLRPDFHYARLALGSVLERLDDNHAAIDQYHTVIKRARGDRESEAQAFERLGSLASRDDDDDDAERYYERALTIHRLRDDAAAVHRVLEQLADIAMARGDRAEAIARHREGLEAAMACGDVVGSSSSLGGLEVLDAEQGFDADTENVVQQSIGWFAEHEAWPMAADAAMLLGEINRRRGKLVEAERFYERAREVSQKNGHDRGTARAFGALGLMRMGDKEYSHADWYFTTAAGLYEKLGDEGNCAVVLSWKGWNFRLQGDYHAAREQFQRAIARYSDAGLHERAKKLRADMEAAGL